MKRISLLVLLFVMVVANTPVSKACTNFLVTKGASTDGSTMITYAADSHALYGELYFWAAATYPAGTMMKINEWDSGKFLGEIPQATQTYRVNGNMNEHSLAIGETTFGGLKELRDSTGIMDYGSLIYVTLQRAKNAREAIKVMTDLVANYGYYSGGESFSIADPNEVWVLEMVGKGTKYKADKKGKVPTTNSNKGAVWVAIRIPDGYISAHANQARIQTFPLANGKTSITSKQMDKKLYDPAVEVIYAHDVVEVAREYNLFNGKDAEFSFSDIYNPLEFGGARGCDARVWSFFKGVNKDMWKYQDYAMGHDFTERMPLYIKPDAKISPKQVMDFMRDHYEGTKMDMTKDIGAGPHKLPYRWRPMRLKVDGKEYVNERAIATQQTAFWFMAQSRNWMPDQLAGIIWFGVDDAATSCLTPIYSASTKTPHEFAVGNGDLLTYSPTSAFWIFSRVANSAYLRYDAISADVVKVINEIENRDIEAVKKIDEQAAAMYKENPAKAIEFVTDYSVKTAGELVNRWNQLDQYLLVKYIDGNIKKEQDGKFTRNPYGLPASPDQPAYPEFWQRAIVDDAGETLKVVEPKR